MPIQRLLYRREASDYLATEHGLDIRAEQLAYLAVNGGGPPFRLLAGKPYEAVYRATDLDAWAKAYLGPFVTRVAEHPAYQGSVAA
jgi:hypothetical protein